MLQVRISDMAGVTGQTTSHVAIITFP